LFVVGVVRRCRYRSSSSINRRAHTHTVSDLFIFNTYIPHTYQLREVCERERDDTTVARIIFFKMKRLLQQQQQQPPPPPREDTVAVCFYGNDNPDADSDDADNFYGDRCCKDSGIAHHPTKQQPKRKNRTWDDDDDDNSQIERYHDGDYYCRVDDGRRCHSARIIIPPPPPPPPTSSSSLSCSEFNIRTPQRTSIRWWLLPHQCRTRKEYHPRRRRWWSIPFPQFGLLFILLWNVIMIRGTAAEDASSSAYPYYYSNNYNDDDDNDNTASSTSTTQQQQPILNPIVTTNYCTLTSSSSYPNNQNYRITVSLLSVLCDTPGAYYSGSTAYRNSPVCVAGDKVKLDIVCTLRGDCLGVLLLHIALVGFTNSLGSPIFFFYPKTNQQFGYPLD
jgi:hypothetical protein